MSFLPPLTLPFLNHLAVKDSPPPSRPSSHRYHSFPSTRALRLPSTNNFSALDREYILYLQIRLGCDLPCGNLPLTRYNDHQRRSRPTSHPMRHHRHWTNSIRVLARSSLSDDRGPRTPHLQPMKPSRNPSILTLPPSAYEHPSSSITSSTELALEPVLMEPPTSSDWRHASCPPQGGGLGVDLLGNVSVKKQHIGQLDTVDQEDDTWTPSVGRVVATVPHDCAIVGSTRNNSGSFPIPFFPAPPGSFSLDLKNATTAENDALP